MIQARSQGGISLKNLRQKQSKRCRELQIWPHTESPTTQGSAFVEVIDKHHQGSQTPRNEQDRESGDRKKEKGEERGTRHFSHGKAVQYPDSSSLTHQPPNEAQRKPLRPRGWEYAILSVNSSRTPATPTAASLSTCPPPRRRLLLCASESSSWPARISRP